MAYPRHKELLFTVLKRERSLKLTASIIMLFGGAVFMWLMLNSAYNRLAVLCALVSMTLLIFGFKFLYDTIDSWHPHNTTIWEIIKNRPRDIVWVYTELTETLPYGVKVTGKGTIFFKMIDRKEISLSVPAKYLKPLSESLNPVLPHATFGYTSERAQWYVASPDFLIRYGE